MSKEMRTTQPGILLMTDKDCALQITDVITVNGKVLPFDKVFAWIMDAFNEKAKRTPDPETGLVPCGCGGPAGLFAWDGNYQAGCTECSLTTEYFTTPELAKVEWNGGMGWRHTNDA